MPNILPDLLYQVALYWGPGDLQEDGTRDFDSVSPVEIPCHWSHTENETTDVEGEQYTSQATVQTSTEVKRRGVLWLSSATVKDAAGTAILEFALSGDPIPMNQIVQNVKRFHDIEATEILYEAMV